MKALYIVPILFLLTGFVQKTESIYVCKEVKTRLFSEAPLENIEATSVKGFSVLNLATSEVQFNIPISSFQFKKSLMKEHFNENYMESDKYPNATFKGKINQQVDPNKDGEFAVTVTGDLEVHGVKQPRTLKGTVKIANRQISISSVFDVMCKDHQIKIPSLVFKNIAETIQITVSGNFNPYPPTKT